MLNNKRSNYKLDNDSKYDLDFLENFIGMIEEKTSELLIFKMPKDKAIELVLLVHSELSFMHLQGKSLSNLDLSIGIDGTGIDERNNESLIQESLKWALRYINKFCEESARNKYEIPTRKEVLKFLVLCYKVDSFYNVLASASKTEYLLKMSDDKIQFVSDKSNIEFLAYSAWRQVYREKKDLNFFSEFDFTLLKSVHSNDFYMSLNWNLERYTIDQFKRFSESLEEISIRWFKNYIKKNKKIILGSHSFDGLVRVATKEWWVSQMINLTGLEVGTLNNIVQDFTYVELKNNDPAYQFFIPVGKKLALPLVFFNSFVRPERNFMALLPKKNKDLFSKLTNDCEDKQIEYIKRHINNKNIIIVEKKTKAQAIRKGMDLMLLDLNTLELLVIELKWRVPPSSTWEMYATDEVIKKGLKQIGEAKNWIEKNIDSVLFEYLGLDYYELTPNRVGYCVVINENVGTGTHCAKDAPVITLDHLIELLQFGVGKTIDVIDKGEHVIPSKYITEKQGRFDLYGYEIRFPAVELSKAWLEKST